MSVFYKLYQDNRTNSTHQGEWYARAKASSRGGWKGFLVPYLATFCTAKHIQATHRKVYQTWCEMCCFIIFS